MQIRPKNNTDFLSSPPKVPVTFSSFAVCNYAAYKSDNTPVHFKGQVLDLQKCLVLFWRFGGYSALQFLFEQLYDIHVISHTDNTVQCQPVAKSLVFSH